MKKTVLFLQLLVVGSTMTSCYKESFVTIETKFTTEFVNGDESVPVILKINNLTTGADTYEWEFQGGSPATANSKIPPQILYTAPGIYSIKLNTKNSDGEQGSYSKTIVIKDAIGINFNTQIIQSNYSPVEVNFNNATSGTGLSYNWTFSGGSIATFSGQNPPNVIFTTPGNHDIVLTVSNGFETFSQTKSIIVAPYLISAFTWQPIFFDDDYQAPVTLNFLNQSISATSFNWSFPSGSPSSSNLVNPTITFNNPGTYAVSLTAINDKTTQVISYPITIYPDTNLRVLNDVKFGINSAHNNNLQGAFYAISTRENYKANEVNTTNSGLIDIAFQGLNSNFTYNKFIAPNQVQNFGFLSLTPAQNTIFINSQNLCNCGLNFTQSQFDAMTTDLPLQGLVINNSIAGAQEFNNTIPRIVLFKTQDGRKGAIKIKNFVNNGSGSFLVCDIKVQKQ